MEVFKTTIISLDMSEEEQKELDEQLNLLYADLVRDKENIGKYSKLWELKDALNLETQN